MTTPTTTSTKPSSSGPAGLTDRQENVKAAVAGYLRRRRVSPGCQLPESQNSYRPRLAAERKTQAANRKEIA